MLRALILMIMFRTHESRGLTYEYPSMIFWQLGALEYVLILYEVVATMCDE